MAASPIQNPAVAVSKKKKGKVERTESPAPAASEKATSVNPTDANSDEPIYLREISKNIRNVNKKITNASKTDGLIAENKDKSLEELVALKIINADQKAQHLKKPALLAQLAQLEEQHAQLKKIDSEFRQRLVAEKTEVTKTLTEKFEQEKAAAVREVTEAAEADAKKQLNDALLTLSQFLRLAAARRADDQNAQQDENLALEGVLLQVYAGDETGVATMLKLVQGAEETTKSVTGEPLQTTFAQVKAVSAALAAPLYQAEPVEEAVQDVAPEAAQEVAQDASHEVQTDPTIAHASLTEIDAGDDTPLTNGHAAEESGAEGVLANADVADAAANEAGESRWDTGANQAKDLSMSQEWVEVPRDPAETETGLEATSATVGNKQSWADEQPEHPTPVAAAATSTPAAAAATPATADDGFHQVQRHNRGRSERDVNWRGRGGGFRGRGRGGEGRGRGGRGRGNGGPGGNGGNFRGPRRTEEVAV